MGIFNATATYGRGFKPTGAPDEFKIRIYTGGFAGAKTAQKRAEEECDAYKSTGGYASYSVKNRRFNFFPSYHEFTVKFSRP